LSHSLITCMYINSCKVCYIATNLLTKFYTQRLLCCTVDEISDLNERLVGLQQTKDQDREMFEQQLQQLRNEYRETKEQLSSDNMMLGT